MNLKYLRELVRNDIPDYCNNITYKKLDSILTSKSTLSVGEKEEVLLRFAATFLKEKINNDPIIQFIAENMPDILSYEDFIHARKPMLKFVWTFLKKDEQLIDEIFDELNFKPQKYEIQFSETDIIIRIVNLEYSYTDLEHTKVYPPYSNLQEIRIIGYKPFEKLKSKMIKHGMVWYTYSVIEECVSRDCFNLSVRKLTISSDDEGWSKEGYREDLKQGFRSTWEANIARILNYKNIKYEYESEYIQLDLSNEKVNITPTYIPDFILDDGSIIEVKGFWDSRSKAKMKLVKEQYPDRKILVIDCDLYTCINKKYSSIIDTWEEDKPSLTDDIIQVVGITIPTRKPFVSALKKGEILVLVRDLNNEYDGNAVMITNNEGKQIGFMAKDCASIYAPKFDMGFQYKLTVKEFEPKVIQCRIKCTNSDAVILPEIFR
jgi:hypothetical protein